jgi:hypothetical protein
MVLMVTVLTMASAPRADAIAVSITAATAAKGSYIVKTNGQYNTGGAPTGFIYINPKISVQFQMGANIVVSDTPNSILTDPNWNNTSTKNVAPAGQYNVHAYITVQSYDTSKKMVVGMVGPFQDTNDPTMTVTTPGT